MTISERFVSDGDRKSTESHLHFAFLCNSELKFFAAVSRLMNVIAICMYSFSSPSIAAKGENDLSPPFP